MIGVGKVVRYASIRSRKQEKADDLSCQIDELNFKHKEFTALLGQIHAGGVCQVAALHKDRLCPFGPLVKWVLETAGAKFAVHGDDVPSRKGGE